MNSIKKSTAFHAFKTTIPVLFGYVPIGMAYGFLLVKTGLEWYWAPLMCIIIFAGAAQFLALSLFAQQKSAVEMAIAVFLINARHMVYGISLLERFSLFKWAKPYLIYGLTDETYALLTTVDPPEWCDHERFDFWITLFNQSYWTAGSTIGALIGSVIMWDAPGLDFALTALFIVLLVEQIKALKRPGPFIAAAAGVLVFNLLGFSGQALTGGIVLGSASCFFMVKMKKEVVKSE
ncbi:MAG: AzlC family ABC transporter permease [Spirochaetia bacterium]|jgi:4-azaleucine resistance transporter AzlC|nr:AzlC family ABC transporter permease [Spirochaetia bacterium]